MRPWVLSAFGVRHGGALVLLRGLLAAAGPALREAWIDARAQHLIAPLVPAARLHAVPPTVADRLRALAAAPRSARDGEVLLCFNSLPPLRRSAARTVVYVHAPYLVGLTEGVRFSRRDRVLHAFEALLLRRGRANADAWWVQTPTMARALAPIVGAAPELVPFVDGDVALPAIADPAPRRSARFFFPADAAAHKNHVGLIRAWALLAAEGATPELVLTLTDGELAAMRATAGTDTLPGVHAIGRVPRERVFAELRRADAMIFPSLAETFGIPFLEAAGLGVPILAAERDYVRDMCAPAQSFDPASPRSIADAVLRFLGRPRPSVVPLDAAAFARRLLG